VTYGHAERTLAAIRLLEAETVELLDGLPELDGEQASWLREVTSLGRTLVPSPRQPAHAGLPDAATAMKPAALRRLPG
jgi:hypothetical protein